MTTATRIGAPNSIARYASNTSWGENEWAVFEYVGGMPVVRAAGSKSHCERYMNDDRQLVDIRPYKQTDGPFDRFVYQAVVPYNRDLDIRNTDALPRGLGCRFLRCLVAHDGALIAKQWHRQCPKRSSIPPSERIVEFAWPMNGNP